MTKPTLEDTEVVSNETTPTLYCTYHPGRETVLRCNRCDKPICYECAIRTPVGYRCKECVRGQQAIYFNARSHDLVIAAVIALVLGAFVGALGYALLRAFGFFSLIATFFIGPMVGGLIAEAVRRGVQRRRARNLNWVVMGATVVGMLIGGLLLLFVPSLLTGAPLGAFARALPTLITRWDMLLLAALAASTIYARLQ